MPFRHLKILIEKGARCSEPPAVDYQTDGYNKLENEQKSLKLTENRQFAKMLSINFSEHSVG